VRPKFIRVEPLPTRIRKIAAKGAKDAKKTKERKIKPDFIKAEEDEICENSGAQTGLSMPHG